MSRLAFPLALLLLLTRPASAEETETEPPQPRGYVGVSASVFIFAGELAVQGGYRPFDELGFFWLHAKVLAGDDSSGDRLRYKYRAAVGGIELRSTGRRFRGVIGFDLGVAWAQRFNEGEPDGKETKLAPSWHGGGELVVQPAVISFGLTGAAYRGYPMFTLGFAVQF